MREQLETGRGKVPLWALLPPSGLRLGMLTRNGLQSFHASFGIERTHHLIVVREGYRGGAVLAENPAAWGCGAIWRRQVVTATLSIPSSGQDSSWKMHFLLIPQVPFRNCFSATSCLDQISSFVSSVKKKAKTKTRFTFRWLIGAVLLILNPYSKILCIRMEANM